MLLVLFSNGHLIHVRIFNVYLFSCVIMTFLTLENYLKH